MMTSPRRQMMMVAGLFGVVIVVYARALHRPTASSKPVTTPLSAAAEGSHEAVATSPIPPSTLGAIPLLPERSQQREFQRKEVTRLSWDRDPFSSHLLAMHVVETLALNGILWDATQPMAIINGQTLSIGQEVDGYRITSISPDHVLVTDGNQTLQLNIAP